MQQLKEGNRVDTFRSLSQKTVATGQSLNRLTIPTEVTRHLEGSNSDKGSNSERVYTDKHVTAEDLSLRNPRFGHPPAVLHTESRLQA